MSTVRAGTEEKGLAGFRISYIDGAPRESSSVVMSQSQENLHKKIYIKIK